MTMIDVRCKNCNKIIAKAESMNAAIKCPKCYMIFEYKIYPNLVSNYDYDNKSLQQSNKRGNLQIESSETNT